MADLDTNTALLIAVISALSLVVGPYITARSNRQTEREKSEREREKALREEEGRDKELHDQAYIKFLSITKAQVYSFDEEQREIFDPEMVEDTVAHAFKEGSPKISSIIHSAYPLESWEALVGVKKAIMKEILIEKGEEYRIPVEATSKLRWSQKAKSDETK